MQIMNQRERLMAVLNNQNTDRRPWYADLSYLYSALKEKGELDEKYWEEEGYLQFHKDLGAGVCFYAPFPWRIEYTGNVKFEEWEEGGLRFESYKTQVGEIRSVQKYLPETYSWGYQEHFIKTIEDLRVMLNIFENSRYCENYKEFSKIDALWGEYGIATGIPPISVSAIQKLLTRWAGVEKTIDLYMDHTEEFEEIIKKIEGSQEEVFEIICRSPAQYIEFAENLSSEITGKNFFEKYNMPCYVKAISRLHEAGKFVGIHIDGTLGSCLPLLRKCGFDVAEAVTPHPVGDVKVEDLRDVAGDGIVIWGGLPGALFSPVYSDEEFESHVRIVLDTFKDDKRFVLGVADQVPADGLISRVRLVREMVERNN